jgi:8-oxo-dGTP diphosphatase
VTDVVRAAGGLVTRHDASGTTEILVVHRPAYDDWSFPKGKLDPGESEAEAAVREVEEETGLRCRLAEEVGVTSYRDGRGRPKTVRYWRMSPLAGELTPANEVDDARWVSLVAARSLLTHPRDVGLLDELDET